MIIIDAHCSIGKGVGIESSAEELLREMDKNKVAKAVICPTGRFIAVYNKEGNDYILQCVKKYPDRFIGFCSVNPWYGRKGLVELKRCLDGGMRGLLLHPFLQGFLLNDSLTFPLLEEMAKYHLPVYFHTGTLVCSNPYQLRDVAENFPGVNFIMGHSGASDYWNDSALAGKGISNIYYETSLVWPDLIERIMADIPAERLVFGSGFPREALGLEIDKIKMVCPEEKKQKLLFETNITRLIG